METASNILDVSNVITGDDIAKRIEARMMEAGYNPRSLADTAKLNPTGVRDIITRKVRDPKYDTLARIATALNISVAQLLGEAEGPIPERVELDDTPPAGTALVPVFDVAASAGFGALVDYEVQTHSLAFPPDYLKSLTSSSPGNLAIIAVKGDSMEPTLLDNDIVLVDMSKRHMGFEGMFVLRQNDTLLVKRASMAGRTGFAMMISDNKNYPAVEVKLDEIEVIGKVLWYGRKV